jgi:hypothetical protein
VAGVRIRSGVFAAWATAWLAGAVAYDEVVARVTGADEPHRATGAVLGGVPEAVPVGWVLPLLRERSAGGVTVVLPVPGDPRGLPGPGPFSAAALVAGEAVVGDGIGLVPTVTEHGAGLECRSTCVVWTVTEIGAPVADPLTVAEAEHELSAATRDAASALAALGVASWRPEAAQQAAQQAARMRHPVSPDLPPGHDPRAVRLLAQAERLAVVLDLAGRDAPGGAVTGAQARARDEVLRLLSAAVRRARAAAYNAVRSRHR